jgi:aryl-alcohol dehydrogenase-like predicted oxidoreductase
MRYNPLGDTGLFVSELCLGTMTFGNSPGQYAAASGVTQAQAEAIIRRGFDAGINFIDTANVYAGGQSEEMVGQALKSLGISRHQVVLATKAEHATGSGPNDGGASRYHLLNEVKASLKRLGTDHIDLYQLHGWDPATPVEATIRALDDLVRQGLVRYIGVSNWAAWQIAKALGTAERLHAERFQSVQAYYSLASRDLEREVIPVAESENLGLLVYSPLAGGYLTGKYRAGNAEGRRATVQFPPVDEQKGAGVLAAMDDVAKAHNTTLAAIALAWLRHQPAVTSIILGIKQPHQLDDNLKATELTLTNDDLQALDAASAPAPEYPGWMLAHSSAARQHLLISGQLAPQHG